MPSSSQQPILFLSDVHLGGFSEEENARIESELIQLINFCQRNDIQIAILGDLFDYWMEYPDHRPKLADQLLQRFQSYNKAMGPTLFVTGNHDNWTREFLPECGFDLEHEYRILQIADRKIMVMHGDGLRDKKLNYRRPLMHRILRNEKFVRFYQAVFPPRAGVATMKYFSRFNRFLEENPQESKIKELNRWAEKTLNTHDIDVIICGHDHSPRKHTFDFGTYINLGTFYRHRSMAFYNNEELSLVIWHPKQQTLRPFKFSI